MLVIYLALTIHLETVNQLITIYCYGKSLKNYYNNLTLQLYLIIFKNNEKVNIFNFVIYNKNSIKVLISILIIHQLMSLYFYEFESNLT